MTDIATAPQALPSFVFSLSFLPFLGRKFFGDLPKLREQALLIGCRLCAIDVCLLAMPNLEDVHQGYKYV